MATAGGRIKSVAVVGAGAAGKTMGFVTVNTISKTIKELSQRQH